MTDEERMLLDFLYGKVNKLELSRKETAKLLDVSTSTLDRLRLEGKGPEYKKMDSKSFNGSVRYPLHLIVKYIMSCNIKTI